MTTWKRRITDKFPKLTRKETMAVIVLLCLTVFFISSKNNFTSKYFSCSSEGNIKIGEKK